MKRLPAVLCALPSGREPVRDWLKDLDRHDRKIVGEDIKDVEFSWPIGMPVCRSQGSGLEAVFGRFAATCRTGGSVGCCSA